MPAGKGGNAKKESGRAKKAENEAKKQEAASAAKEKQEAAEWDKGAKSNKKADDAAAKKAAEAARKAENARLLAEEESSLPSKAKAAPKAAKKSAPKPAGPGAIAAGGGLSTSVLDSAPKNGEEPVESFSATGIDNALDMLSLVNAKTDKASVGSDAAKLDSHPERRFKAAFEAYLDRELPLSRRDNPGLRLQQHRDLIFKRFQKSPENPFNQTTVSYNASNEEKVSALQEERTRTEDRLREREA